MLTDGFAHWASAIKSTESEGIGMHRSVSTLENSRLSVYRRVPRSRPFFARVRCALVLMGGVLGLSACASVGTVNDPVGRSLTWYSYLNGDDIRDRCDSEAPDEMRLVFNGRYREQVRQYDLTPWPQPGLLNVLVTQGANLLAGGWTLDDPLGPWRGETFPVRLTAEQNASLWAALERDGAFTPPPRGLALPSTHLYWVVSGCHNGQGFFHAWKQGTAAYATLTFPSALLPLDVSGIAFAPEQPQGMVIPSDPRGSDGYFELLIGETGIVHAATRH